MPRDTARAGKGGPEAEETPARTGAPGGDPEGAGAPGVDPEGERAPESAKLCGTPLWHQLGGLPSTARDFMRNVHMNFL